MKLILVSTDNKGQTVYLNTEGFWTLNKEEAERFNEKQDFCMESFYGTEIVWEEDFSSDESKGELWVADNNTKCAVYVKDGVHTLYIDETPIFSSIVRDEVALKFKQQIGLS